MAIDEDNLPAGIVLTANPLADHGAVKMIGGLTARTNDGNLHNSFPRPDVLSLRRERLDESIL